jgi:chalcone isomerase-like protein
MKGKMKQFITALVLVLGFTQMSFAKEVAGVQIPDSIKAGDSQLALNGAGIRTKLFMDIYVGGLYLQKSANDANAIIVADEPMALKLHMVSGLITSDKMTSATTEGFENATNGKVKSIQTEINAFMDVFKEEIQENDIFDIVYLPGTGVEVYKNGKLKDTIKSNMEFKKALFGIWLSENPAHEGLKESMLGS